VAPLFLSQGTPPIPPRKRTCASETVMKPPSLYITAAPGRAIIEKKGPPRFAGAVFFMCGPISWGHVSDVAHNRVRHHPSMDRQFADAINQQPITSIVSNRNGVVSNATKPRTRHRQQRFQRASRTEIHQARSSCGSMTTIGSVSDIISACISTAT
jgi:hypothetical protein